MDFSSLMSVYKLIVSLIPGSSYVPFDLPKLPVLIVFYLWLFHSLYVIVMAYYRAHLRSQQLPPDHPLRLNWYHYVAGAPWLLLGLLFDVVANATIAWFVFKERPKEWLVTTRLVRYLDHPEQYTARQVSVATYVCVEWLDPFDPTDDHCKRTR